MQIEWRKLSFLFVAATLFVSPIQAQTLATQTYKNSKAGFSFEYPQGYVVADPESLESVLSRRDLFAENKRYFKHLKSNGFGWQVALVVDPPHPAGVFLTIVDLSAKGTSLEQAIEDLEYRGKDNDWDLRKRDIQLAGNKVKATEVVRTVQFKTRTIKGHRLYFEIGEKPYVIQFRNDPSLDSINSRRIAAYELIQQTLKAIGG